jgi:hypothetical protein
MFMAENEMAIHRYCDIPGVSNPGSFEDVVELLIPELQRRGLYRTEYPVPGGTFRENIHSRSGESLLPKEHPAAGYRWT